MMFLRLLILSALCANFAHAQSAQDHSLIKRAVETWLKDQLKGLPGEVSYEVGSPATSTQLAACNNFDISRPVGAPAWGRGHVSVRCIDAANWRINVQINIRVKTDYYIAARAIPQGQAITTEDLAVLVGDLSELPAKIITDSQLAIGKMAAVSIQAGNPLRSDMLKALPVIRQGQTVKLISRGNGFEVSSEGRALNNAAEGQLAQIRMANGQVVSGTARSGGTVEVSF